MEKIKNVKGSYDYGSRDQIIRNFISDTLKSVFNQYGYKPLSTSILCYYELLALKYKEDNEILNEIYKVTDQAKRNLGLRYDLTVPFAKYIAINKNINLPYKRYEIGKVFRDGPVKKGRIREFIQCDVDSVGIEGQLVEAELISLFVEGFKRLGIDIIIKYNNRKIMVGIIEICEVTKEKINQVITIIDKFEKLTKEDKVIIKNMKIGLQLKVGIEEIPQKLKDLDINYKILNPGGNKTAIVIGNQYNEKLKKEINDKILKENLDVEQVGFIDTKENKLEMAGGEFCANAARCAVWEYLGGKPGKIELNISGYKEKIKGGITKQKDVYVNIQINKNTTEIITKKRYI